MQSKHRTANKPKLQGRCASVCSSACGEKSRRDLFFLLIGREDAMNISNNSCTCVRASLTSRRHLVESHISFQAHRSKHRNSLTKRITGLLDKIQESSQIDGGRLDSVHPCIRTQKREIRSPSRLARIRRGLCRILHLSDSLWLFAVARPSPRLKRHLFCNWPELKLALPPANLARLSTFTVFIPCLCTHTESICCLLIDKLAQRTLVHLADLSSIWRRS